MNRTKAHEAFAKGYAKDGHHAVTLCECGTCGHTELGSAYKADEFSFRAVLMDYPCQRCHEVFLRNPEIAWWVVNVVRMQIDHMAKKMTAPAPGNSACVSKNAVSDTQSGLSVTESAQSDPDRSVP